MSEKLPIKIDLRYSLKQFFFFKDDTSRERIYKFICYFNYEEKKKILCGLIGSWEIEKMGRF